MTAPTQAQIEAAATAMEQEMFAPHELPLDNELHGKYLHTAQAAITAAAEAGYSEPQGTGFQAGEAEPAAVEAGKPTDFLGMGLIIKDQTAELERLRKIIKKYEDEKKEQHDAQVDRYVTLGNAMKMQTIERCAQVAENIKENTYPGTRSLQAKIAAAIRAMKDE